MLNHLKITSLFTLIAIYLFAPAIQAQDQYMVEYNNGSIVYGQKLRELGSNQRNPSLDGRHTFLQNDKSIRLFRNTRLTRQVKAPYIVMMNGDIIPGLPTSLKSHDSINAGPKILWIQTSEDVSRINGGPLPVRIDQVQMVVSVQPQSPPEFTPGRVVLKNGQRLIVSAIRWQADGVRLLMNGEILSLEWKEIAQLHQTHDHRIQSLVSESRIATLMNRSLCTWYSEDTARLTTMNQVHFRRRIGNVDGIVLQPFWALRPIMIKERQVSSIQYRQMNQVPLSSLPHQTIEQEAPSGAHWPWQRDLAVTGKALFSGEYYAPAGIGMHAFTRVRFTLPKGSESFNARIGLDESVANGGQAMARLDLNGGEKIYQSPVLIGNQKTELIKNIPLKNAKSLDLIADPLAQRFQSGDPLDIRDHLNWLNPQVSLSKQEAQPGPDDFRLLLPYLDGWNIDYKPDYQPAMVQAATYLSDRSNYLWLGNFKPTKEGITLSRSLKIKPEMGFFILQYYRTEHDVDYQLDLKVLGEDEQVLYESQHSLKGQGKHKTSTLRIPTSAWINQRVSILIEIKSPFTLNDLKKRKAYFRLGSVGFEHWMRNPQVAPLPLTPDIAMEEVKGLKLKSKAKDNSLNALSLSPEKMDDIGYRQLDQGLKFLEYIQIDCPVPPNSKHFVMTLGSTREHYHDYINFLVNDKVVYSGKIKIEDKQGPYQLIFDIPEGAKNIKFVTKGRRSMEFIVHQAGFMLNNEE